MWSSLSCYWQIRWKLTPPTIIVVLIVFNFLSGSNFTYNDYVYPSAFQALGRFTEAVPFSLMVFTFACVYCFEGGCLVSALPPIIFHARMLISCPLPHLLDLEGTRKTFSDLGSRGRGAPSGIPASPDRRSTESELQSLATRQCPTPATGI